MKANYPYALNNKKTYTTLNSVSDTYKPCKSDTTILMLSKYINAKINMKFYCEKMRFAYGGIEKYYNLWVTINWC